MPNPVLRKKLVVRKKLSASSITPSSYTGLMGWWKADSFSLSDGTAIGGTGNEWIDQSTNSRNATQSSAGLRPLFKINIFGSKPAIKFDGSDDILSITSMTLDAHTIFCVGSVTADSQLLGSNIDGNTQVRIKRSGANVISYFDGTHQPISDAFSAAANVGRLMVWRKTVAGGGDTWMAFEGKTPRITGSPPALGSGFTIHLNEIGGNLNIFAFMAGYVGELVVYNESRTDLEVAALYDGYFSGRWGV